MTGQSSWLVVSPLCYTAESTCPNWQWYVSVFKLPFFNFVFQKFSGSEAFLTKGPFAKFLGGPQLLAQLSDTQSPTHPALILVCLLSLTLHVLMRAYRWRKNQEDRGDYAATLRQQAINGARSPFKMAFLSVSFILFLSFLAIHFFLTESIKKVLIRCNKIKE